MRFGSSLVFLPLILAVSVGIWAGLVCLGRGRRDLPWWLMVGGALLFTSSCLARFVMFSALVSMLSPFGILLFATGFALHGMTISRLRERVAELEQVTAAMNEELSRR